jgi:restriction system protein
LAPVRGAGGRVLSRLGFVVELGPGPADGGIDIRLWPNDATRGLPPTVLVQCKRQRGRIEQTVIKAFWADVEHEQAAGGLILTTSSFAPGAGELRTARGYTVGEGDRDTLRQWVGCAHPARASLGE